jgi:lia operon protein LiaG
MLSRSSRPTHLPSRASGATTAEFPVPTFRTSERRAFAFENADSTFRWAIIAAVVTAAVLIIASALGAQSLGAQDRATERHTLTGNVIAIWNLAGEVRVESGSGNDVVVEVIRGGADGRRLEVIANGGRLAVRYPATEVVYHNVGSRNWRSSTSLNMTSEGTFDGDWRSGGRRTSVRSYGDGLEAHADLVIRVPRGKQVEVNLAVGNVEVNNVEADLLIDVHAASINAHGTKGRLGIDAGSGSVRVEDATGDLDIDTGSGSTTLTNLMKMTSVTIDAGSGTLTARGVETLRLSADIGSGGVTIDGLATDDLNVETGSGSVRIELTKVPARTDLESGSGSVQLMLPAEVNADVDIETGSGGISSDFPVTMQDFGRRQLRGRIGQGGPQIRVNTGSGGVRLLKR